ncbi:hypothetical protein HOI83_00865 [Candidatus Uhrbacteria bacterium]|nr:hypothetical protein [Candidatus Uhrbacteria bacterium]
MEDNKARKPGQGEALLADNEFLKGLRATAPKAPVTSEPTEGEQMTGTQRGEQAGISLVKDDVATVESTELEAGDETRKAAAPKKVKKTKKAKKKKARKKPVEVRLNETEAGALVERIQAYKHMKEGTHPISDMIEMAFSVDAIEIKQGDRYKVSIVGAVFLAFVMELSLMIQGIGEATRKAAGVTLFRRGNWIVVRQSAADKKSKVEKVEVPREEPEAKTEAEAPKVAAEVVDAGPQPSAEALAIAAEMSGLSGTNAAEEAEEVAPVAAPEAPKVGDVVRDLQKADREHARSMMDPATDAILRFLGDGGEVIGLKITDEMRVKGEGDKFAKLVIKFRSGVPCIGTKPVKGLDADTVITEWSKVIAKEDHPLHPTLEFPGGDWFVNLNLMPCKEVDGVWYLLPLPIALTDMELLKRAKRARGKQIQEEKRQAAVERREEEERQKAKGRERSKAKAKQWCEENLPGIFQRRKGSKMLREGCVVDGKYEFEAIAALHEGCSCKSDGLCKGVSKTVIIVGEYSWLLCLFHGEIAFELAKPFKSAIAAKRRAAREVERLAQRSDREVQLDALREDPYGFLAFPEVSGTRKAYSLNQHLGAAHSETGVPFVRFADMCGDGVDPLTGEDMTEADGFLIFVPADGDAKRRRMKATYRPVLRTTFELVTKKGFSLPYGYHMVLRWRMIDFVTERFSESVLEIVSETPRRKSSGGANNKRKSPKKSHEERQDDHAKKVAEPGYGAAKPKKKEKSKKELKAEAKAAKKDKK